jgi:protein TonB
MAILRPLAFVLSLGLHALIVLALVGVSPGGAALDAGTGDDIFVVEQGIALEGVTKFGEAEEMVETIDIPPVQQTAEPQPVEPIDPELTEVVTSKESEHEDNVVTEKPPEIVEEKPVAVPVEEQAPQVATLIEKSSGEAQEGGNTNARRIYLGSVRKSIERNKVNPRSKISGTVMIRFTVGPKGDVLSREITQSSGSKILDDAAMAALDRAAPFPPMPDEIARGNIEVQVPFRFVTR